MELNSYGRLTSFVNVVITLAIIIPVVTQECESYSEIKTSDSESQRQPDSFLIDSEKDILSSHSTMNHQFHGSELLNDEYASKLVEWTNSEFNWNRIYSGKADGLIPENFHKDVDNKGSCIIIIESDNGSIFGGYTSVGFISARNGMIYGDPYHFLFTLKNPHDIPPTRFVNKYPEESISYVDVYGPMFGSRSDLVIRGHTGNFELSHVINFPWSYVDTTGKGNMIFTNSEKFSVKNMEVFVRD